MTMSGLSSRLSHSSVPALPLLRSGSFLFHFPMVVRDLSLAPFFRLPLHLNLLRFFFRSSSRSATRASPSSIVDTIIAYPSRLFNLFSLTDFHMDDTMHQPIVSISL